MNCNYCNKPTPNRKYCSRACAGRGNRANAGRQLEAIYCKYCDTQLPRKSYLDRPTTCITCKTKYADRTLILDTAPVCGWRHCTNKVPEGRKRFCSSKCHNKTKQTEHRLKVKLRAIEYMGGSCCVCGYDRCAAALEFHHRDATTKDFGISSKDTTRSWDAITAELDKCVLLCANCHREAHQKLLTDLTN